MREQAIQYRRLLPILINDWRAHFGAHLPFYIVQLANFRAPQDQPMSQDVWPLMREAQLQTSQRLPDTPLVVTCDLGEVNNVHFHNKQEAARRLALSALNHTYGVAVESSGPTLHSARAVAGAMPADVRPRAGPEPEGGRRPRLRRGRGRQGVSMGDAADRGPRGDAPQRRCPRADLRALRLVRQPARLARQRRRAAGVALPHGSRLRSVSGAAERSGGGRLRRLERGVPGAVRRHGLLRDHAARLRPGRDLGGGAGCRVRGRRLPADAHPGPEAAAQRTADDFLAQNDFDWSQDTWNDDLAWMTLAMLHGYQITGNATFLNKAISAWNIAYDRGWDTNTAAAGSGRTWTTLSTATGEPTSVPSATTRSSRRAWRCTRSPGTPAYLTKSEAIYAWVRANILNTTTGQVNEGVKWPIGKPAGGFLENSDNVYNSGSFLEAANALFSVTGKAQYYQDALLAANHVVDHTPILHDGGRYQTQWAYRFVKGLSEFATDNALWPQYLPWMLRNAQAAWNDRDSNGLTWNDWTKRTDDPKIDPIESSSAVAIWQWLPSPRTPALSGRYEVVNAASRLPLKVAGASTRRHRPVAQGKSRAGRRRRAVAFVPTGGGYYQIKNAKSGLVATVEANSVRAGAKIVQRPAQGFHPGDEWQPFGTRTGRTPSIT